MLIFRSVQVVMALEKIGLYMSSKQSNEKKTLPPFIHLFNTFEGYYAPTVFLSNGNVTMN